VISSKDSTFNRFGLALPAERWTYEAARLLAAAGNDATLGDAAVAAEVAAREPPSGGLGGLAVLATTGWGAMRLPAGDCPAGIAAWAVAEGGRAGREWRRGSDFVLIGDRRRLARGLGPTAACWFLVEDGP
jgi:hypothetical protein